LRLLKLTECRRQFPSRRTRGRSKFKFELPQHQRN
jgi:hypothetical protein